MLEQIASNLGDNVRTLRRARGTTQAQIAEIAELPRSTWALIESGAANPTLGVLTRVAAALAVSVEELIGPRRTAARFYRKNEIPVRKRGAVSIRKLLPDPIPGLEIERLEFPAQGSMTGIPHTPGTREYLMCESGTVGLSVSGESYTLGPGDLVVFRGDQKHGYRNPTGRVAVAYSVVAFSITG